MEIVFMAVSLAGMGCDRRRPTGGHVKSGRHSGIGVAMGSAKTRGWRRS